MGRSSGEQARRRKATTLPALLTSKCMRRCVDRGLLPPTLYRASAPTPEFGSNYFQARDRAKRAAECATKRPAPAPAPAQHAPKTVAPAFLVQERRLEYRRERAAARVDLLMRLQRGYCYLCAQPFYASQPPTLEHVTPRALGGKTQRNVLLAHSACNNGKSDRAPRPCEMIYLDAINLRRHSVEA